MTGLAPGHPPGAGAADDAAQPGHGPAAVSALRDRPAPAAADSRPALGGDRGAGTDGTTDRARPALRPADDLAGAASGAAGDSASSAGVAADAPASVSIAAESAVSAGVAAEAAAASAAGRLAEPVGSAAGLADVGAAGPADGGAAGLADGGARPAVEEWAAAVAALRGLPAGARVLLACHVNPDGDALGSMLGFGLGLRRIAGELGIGHLAATVPGSPELPAPFDRLPGVDLLVAEEEADPAPDAMLVFDVASIERLGELADRLVAAPVGIVLDHHASNPGFGGINLIDPSAAATSVLSEGLLRRLGVPLDAEIAECLYVALATDTGSFKFASTTPAVHELAARLIATGIPVGDISRRLFDTRPVGAVRLFGVALARTVLEHGAAGGLGLVWTYVTLDDLAQFGQTPAAVEALIDTVRCVAEADVACVVKPVRAGEWSVSLRSKGAVDVSRVAVELGGGGHRFAAGFSAQGTVSDVIQAVRTRLSTSAAGRSG